MLAPLSALYAAPASPAVSSFPITYLSTFSLLWLFPLFWTFSLVSLLHAIRRLVLGQ